MILIHNGVNIELADFDEANFNSIPAGNFLRQMYEYLHGELIDDGRIFQLDFDLLDHNRIQRIIEQDNPRVLRRLNGKAVNASEWRNDSLRKSILLFISQFPVFGILIKNIHTDVELSIRSAEILLQENLNAANFLQFKSKIDQLNTLKWTRDQNNNEKQAGVSILGNLSEKLIEVALTQLIDNKKFFRSQNQDVQSYGDFVLMCLPNNLWLSVKSNYARERLLASGFTSDIIGVGFFTEYTEFTSRARIRNFIKVGFLAMYIPDVSITEEQIVGRTNTFQETIEYYQLNNIDLPKNINGKDFIRPLSQLFSDLNRLLQIEETSRRTVINY